jgi:hypothetical protein
MLIVVYSDEFLPIIYMVVQLRLKFRDLRDGFDGKSSVEAFSNSH